MASAKVVPMPVRTSLVCSSCGAAGEGSCRCGAPYVAPGQRAAEAVAANPGKTDRAIAADIGVDAETVRRARKKSGSANAATEKRTGKDGKKYPAKKKAKAANKPGPLPTDPIQEACPDCADEEERWQRSLTNLAGDAIVVEAFWTREFGAAWTKFKATSEVVTLAEQAAAAWRKVADDLKRRKKS